MGETTLEKNHPGVASSVPMAQVPVTDRQSLDASALHTRARASREYARVVIRESIAVRARVERWWLHGSPSGLTSGPLPCGQLVLPAVPDTVRLSRRMVHDLCDLVSMDELADVAELLTGEIVTNAVVHTRTPYLRLSAEVSGGTLRVSVFDSDPQLPTVRHPSEKEPRGRGLMMVDSLANDWGAAQSPGGKLVWFTVSGTNIAALNTP
jgi:Histidine kinase-like ATPase domain